MHSESTTQSRPLEDASHYCSVYNLCALLALTALIVLFCNYVASIALDKYSDNRGYRLIEHKWLLLQNIQQDVDILILGDSSCSNGVNPYTIREITGLTALNLCTTGDTLALEDALMLDYYLQHHKTPKAALIIHAHDTWHRKWSPSAIARIPLQWGFWDATRTYLTPSVRESVHIFLAKYFRMYAENISLAKILLYPWRVSPTTLDITLDGFSPQEHANPANVLKDSEWHANFVRNRPFEMSPSNRHSLISLADIAHTNNLEIFLASAPMYRGLYADKEVRAYLSAVNSELSQIGDRTDRMHIILDHPILFDRFQMENTDHLTSDAASRYTEELLHVILPTLLERK